MARLTREQLLAAAVKDRLPREVLQIPELGGEVIIQGLTGTERDAWEASLVRGKGLRRTINTENVRARLAVRCLVDESGTRLFTDADAAALGNLRVDVLQRIFSVAQKLSGVSDEDVDELGRSSGMADGSGSSSS